jgi:CARDB
MRGTFPGTDCSYLGMSRVGFVPAIAAGLIAAVVGWASPASGASAPPARDQLRSFVCQKAIDPPSRAVSIQSVMRPVTNTAKMQMRFDLMRRTKRGAPFKNVRGQSLGSWLTPSDPTLGQRPGDVWIVNHPVVDLPAPATYRFRVSFRWLGSRGQQLSSAVQTSSTCYQPELRADLLVRSLTVTPLASGQSAYVALIGNRGLTAAGPVEVDLAGVGSATEARTLGSVGPKSSARQRFVGPSCAVGTSLTVTVDPSHTIDEYNFANNALTMACPAPSSG